MEPYAISLYDNVLALPTDPHFKPAAILIAGSKTSHKDSLANMLAPSDLDLEIRFVSHIEHMSPKSSRPHIDIITCTCDMSSRTSFDLLRRNLQCISPEYFLGRVVVVGFFGDEIKVARKEVVEWVTSISEDVPIYFVDAENQQTQQNVALHILKRTRVAAGYIPHVSLLLMDALGVPEQVRLPEEAASDPMQVC
ncbi:uncharacterized protein SPPG_00825 [Spizellomyces punctatus DAOM BR117]|uniref:Centromere protein M n=1 Tax=Spizellomyces punctatus (strain DAOM BR117) TaxID=645134 RepID=A0A0L0HVP7_SPIPD|nr:uncharacterized protein SPPG_00825 [Spizellomyces punctatus DAOM BR117]KND05157.1 hypothetical protein SPPG_00825 [Spizellomyces punctatus DAOM BR117]|eukprot:XP_016613196.1 hypothetical protein SPPG_00825 [Spizellomyces punctatus DAOM BR117]